MLAALAAGLVVLVSPGGAVAHTPVGNGWLALAEHGASLSAQWHDASKQWYDEVLDDTQRYPLATIWDAVPLFETLDAIELAAPSAAHRARVVRFANYADRYLDHGLKPVIGFAPYPGDRTADVEVWMDDNGWWGLAFDDAYRATGIERYLQDAEVAMRYVAHTGWDRAAGGLWWNTEHPYKSGPALSSNAVLAALLYAQTHSSAALANAQRYLAWGDAHMAIKAGLWETSSRDSDPGDYIEGPMIYAREVLCKAGVSARCTQVAPLATAALARFGVQAPQYDAIYARFMLALATATGQSMWAAPAQSFGADAQRNAADSRGLWLNAWTGGSLGSRVTHPQMLQTHAATSELFAWLAVYSAGSVASTIA